MTGCMVVLPPVSQLCLDAPLAITPMSPSSSTVACCVPPPHLLLHDTCLNPTRYCLLLSPLLQLHQLLHGMHLTLTTSYCPTRTAPPPATARYRLNLTTCYCLTRAAPHLPLPQPHHLLLPATPQPHHLLLPYTCRTPACYCLCSGWDDDDSWDELEAGGKGRGGAGGGRGHQPRGGGASGARTTPKAPGSNNSSGSGSGAGTGSAARSPMAGSGQAPAKKQTPSKSFLDDW